MSPTPALDAFGFVALPWTGGVFWGLLVFSTVYVAHHVAQRLTLRDKSGNNIPHGPIGPPIIGSFLSISKYPELTLYEWTKNYGPMFSLWVGSQLFIVVSDPQITKDLFITNGATFSSRKRTLIKADTILHGRGITSSPYGEIWRRDRRIAKAYLDSRAVNHHAQILDSEATELVRRLYQCGKEGTTPVDVQPHTGRFTLNNMMMILFGTRVETTQVDHPLVEKFLNISSEFMQLTGAVANLTDFVPFLQKIPNYAVKRAQKLHDDMVNGYGPMIEAMKIRIEQGEPVPDCLAKKMLIDREDEKLDDLDVIALCVVFLVGGVASTASILQWFCAVITTQPEIQAKAHAELDQVVGNGRLPTPDDEIHLPYIRALIKELGRCYSPFWLAPPHTSTQDFTYAGYFIPKDTPVMLNLYAMHHDPIRYPDPFKFNPDRYLGDTLTSADSANLSDPYARDHFMFGAGRRICPGMWVAEREIYLVVSRLLWAFRMEEVPGQSIDLTSYNGTAGRTPLPFNVRMVPRHDQVKEVLDL